MTAQASSFAAPHTSPFPSPRASSFAPVVRRDDQTIRALLAEHGSPLLLLDCDRIREQYRSLAAALPGVTLHYAMKALPERAVVATLHDEGGSFDVCATGEIRILRALGISPERMIHTHPIKRDRDIREALELGCRSFVVDNPAELQKLVPYSGEVSLLLRVGFRNPTAVIDLAKKFGCAPEDAFSLLEHASAIGLPIRGLSFHVGSQCSSSQWHVSALGECGALIERTRRAGLAPIDTIDIGGGFPASYQGDVPIGIDDFCAPIRRALADLPSGLRVIAEPGRFIAAPAIEGVATIIGKAVRGGAYWYYLDDGIYGSWNGRIYEGTDYALTVISAAAADPRAAERRRTVLAGPTCDSVDVIAENIWLPELQIGDLVVGSAMGAYTSASASEFNSIPKTKIFVRNGPLLPVNDTSSASAPS